MIDSETKPKAVRRGAQFDFPTADIEQMLKEIEQGYQPGKADLQSARVDLRRSSWSA